MSLDEFVPLLMSFYTRCEWFLRMATVDQEKVVGLLGNTVPMEARQLCLGPRLSLSCGWCLLTPAHSAWPLSAKGSSAGHPGKTPGKGQATSATRGLNPTLPRFLLLPAHLAAQPEEPELPAFPTAKPSKAIS